jgi:hypothetical protein
MVSLHVIGDTMLRIALVTPSLSLLIRSSLSFHPELVALRINSTNPSSSMS